MGKTCRELLMGSTLTYCVVLPSKLNYLNSTWSWKYCAQQMLFSIFNSRKSCPCSEFWWQRNVRFRFEIKEEVSLHVGSNGVTSSKINKTKITSQNIKSGIIPSTTRFQIMPPALNILILTRDLWKTLYTSKTIKAHLNSEKKKSIKSIIFIPIICWQKSRKKSVTYFVFYCSIEFSCKY